MQIFTELDALSTIILKSVCTEFIESVTDCLRADTGSWKDGTTWLKSAFVILRKATIIGAMSVRPPAWNNSAPTGRIFMKFDISVLFENLSRNLKFH